MTGDDFIALASRLLLSNIGDPEARYRSAVSRAYYGAYHLAIEFLSGIGFRVPGNSECHEQAYRALFNSGNADAAEAARLLNDLRAARNEADYKLNKKRLALEANARADIETAGSFQAALRKCREEPGISQIRASIVPVG
jgi:uncharacterized protein (UPF0332 family)